MRYGICTDLQKAELAATQGYDYIELSVTKTLGLDPDTQKAGRQTLKSLSIQAECFNILFPKTMNLVDGTLTWAELQAHLDNAMELIDSFGGKVVVFGSGKCRTCPPSCRYREAYERLVKACRMTGETAASHHIQVVIEPLSRQETNMICTMAEGALLQRDVDLPNVGLLSDYFHVCANHDDLAQIPVIHNFGHIHIASGQGRHYPLPEDGEAYVEFFRALQKASYSGRMSIEGKTNDPVNDGREALQYLKQLEAETCTTK